MCDGRIQQKPRGNYFLFSFLFGLAGAVIFVPFMIVDGGRFFCSTAISMCSRCRSTRCADAIRSSIGWSWTTDLGANFIGSYTFYLQEARSSG